MILDTLNSMKICRFHYRLLVLAGIGWAFDAMDTGIISFIIPMLVKEWHISSSAIGLLGSIGLFGMAIGAILGGTLADHYGRTKIFTWSMIVYGVATALSAIAPNYELLLFFRLLVGLGLGAELPVAATLLTEYSPQAYRGRFMVALESFWAVGWLAAALVAYAIIPIYGWRFGLLVGAIPALYTGIIRRHIPESLRYLLKTGQLLEANKVVQYLESETKQSLGSVTHDDSQVYTNSLVTHLNVKDLLNRDYRVRTIMLWLLWFGIIFSYYGIFLWLPTLVYQQGFTVVKTFEYILLMTLAQLPGYYCAAMLVDWLGRRYTLAIFLLGSGIASYFFGHAETETILLMWGALMSFFNLGAWGVLYTYTPELYPTRIRGLGSGWAAGIGRIGGIIAPLLVGTLLSYKISVDSIFFMFATVFVIIAIVVILLGIEKKNTSLEE
ncbi:MFS transporter [Veillonella montpellierensis]|uniref:MFS transporter n=1 Tax=Veillonella montpellierensis TaxID=187328 RepID=UPI0023F7127A|nr:MFS transporter [Veillonella montpellierensis]